MTDKTTVDPKALDDHHAKLVGYADRVERLRTALGQIRDYIPEAAEGSPTYGWPFGTLSRGQAFYAQHERLHKSIDDALAQAGVDIGELAARLEAAAAAYRNADDHGASVFRKTA
ncbi:hypothetical protein [Catellatospora tritici]|uniref:hypothetical protein n=1 Tax=Catellatospora tritici TaxID=2851566 RepID=UPI001C2CEEC1|nr:hypothetical protein [Catellatospora tritici]MBV1853552.1 hypothetical protein [Catellatospora tritici]